MNNNVINFHPASEPSANSAPPTGFSIATDGIHHETQDKSGETQTSWLCSPVEVVALGRNAQNTAWNRQIKLVDPDGVSHQVFITEKELATGFHKVLARLSDLGLKIANGPNAKKHLKTLLTSWEPSERYTTTDRLGWAGSSRKAFVLGNKEVIGDTNMIFLSDLHTDGAPQMKACGIERTRAFLTANIAEGFQYSSSARRSNAIGYYDDHWIFIPAETWNTVHLGFNPTSAARHLIDRNLLVPGDGRNLQSKTPAWVSGRPRAYKVKASILPAQLNAA